MFQLQKSCFPGKWPVSPSPISRHSKLENSSLLMSVAGFSEAEYEDVTLRMEIGEKVAGLIVSTVLTSPN